MIGNTVLHHRMPDKPGQGGTDVVRDAQDRDVKAAVSLRFLPGKYRTIHARWSRSKVKRAGRRE